jgi:hypothetical protein
VLRLASDVVAEGSGNLAVGVGVLRIPLPSHLQDVVRRITNE